MSGEALSKYDVVIIDEDIILSSIASNQCEIPVSLLRKIYRKATKGSYKHNPEYTKLAGKIKGVLKAIETESMFKLPAFKWDDGEDEDGSKNEKEDVDGIPALTDIPSFCLAELLCIGKLPRKRICRKTVLYF